MEGISLGPGLVISKMVSLLTVSGILFAASGILLISISGSEDTEKDPFSGTDSPSFRCR